MRAGLALHTQLSLRLDAVEAYRLAHAYRDEELQKFADRLSSRATLYGDTRTVNEVIRDLRQVAGAPGDGSATSPVLTATSTDAEAHDGELAMLRGLVRTLRVVVRPDEVDVDEVRRLLHEHASDAEAARKQAPSAAEQFAAGRQEALAGHDPYRDQTTGEDGRS